MKIGLLHLRAHHDSDPAIIARHAEDLGFESYWVGHHTVYPVNPDDHYPGRTEQIEEPEYLLSIPDPWMCLARAAATTSTIKLGTGVWLVAEHDPVLTAIQVSTLDEQSGGRTIVGVGGGWNAEQCKIMGVDYADRWSHVEDHVAALKALWTTDPSEHRGKYVSFPPVRAFPKPAQQPHPPVLIGSTGGKHALRRVARWGDGWIPVISDIDEFAADVQNLELELTAAGRDRDDIDISVFALQGQWRTAAEVRRLGDAGADRVILWLHEMDQDAQLRDLEQLAEEHELGARPARGRDEDA